MPVSFLPFPISRTLIVFFVCGSFLNQFADAVEGRKIKAIAVDAFPVFDPRPVEALAIEMFPEKGRELAKLWRSKLFEYQWLRALGEKYENFEEIAEDALVFAAAHLDVPLSDDAREKVTSAYASLPVWPDVKAAVSRLKSDGYQIVFLSNMTEKMLRAGLAGAGLEEEFDGVYSTDDRQTFKPSPKAYQIALDELHLPREEILFVAFAGWDAAGAKWFGYPTFWVNRSGSSLEDLGNRPDGTGQDLQALLKFLDDRPMTERR